MLRALERVAGNLRFLNLGGCCLLSGVDMAQIMGVVRDVSGCTDEARLSAVAECAQSVLGVALFELLPSVAALRERLQEGTPPYLSLGAALPPGAQHRCGAWQCLEHGLAVGSGVCCVGDMGDIRTFVQKTQQKRTETDLLWRRDHARRAGERAR